MRENAVTGIGRTRSYAWVEDFAISPARANIAHGEEARQGCSAVGMWDALDEMSAMMK